MVSICASQPVYGLIGIDCDIELGYIVLVKS